MPTLELIVPPRASGERLDRFLGAFDEVGSRAEAKRLIDAGAVELDGRLRRASHELSGGERLAVKLASGEPARVAPPADIAVVYIDEAMAVIDQPAGLVVHPAPGHHGRTLVELLGGVVGGGDPGRPGIVHRLDRDTSGLMMVARDDDAHRKLSAQVRRREVGRRYLALVDGHLGSRTGTIDASIGRDPKRPVRMAVAGRAAKGARTHFSVVERLAHETLVEARLETGRTHQIRAHFAAIGHPLLGDSRYGGPDRHGLKRQFLHSHRLGFTHPRSGEPMEFSSDLPPDLRGALDLARAQ